MSRLESTVIQPNAEIPRIGLAELPREPSSQDLQRRNEYLVEALRKALTESGEHRLYRAGKVDGLFASRSGLPNTAAQFALREGHLEITRTEPRGKSLIEWVRATPKAVQFLEQNDSARVILHDLKATIGETRDGLPLWLDQTQDLLHTALREFQERADRFTQQLDELTRRVDAALRRIEPLAQASEPFLPWVDVLLRFLDQRVGAGILGPCRIADLFRVVQESPSQVSLPVFLHELRRLHELRAIRLVPSTQELPDPEFCLVVGSKVCGFVER